MYSIPYVLEQLAFKSGARVVEDRYLEFSSIYDLLLGLESLRAQDSISHEGEEVKEVFFVVDGNRCVLQFKPEKNRLELVSFFMLPAGIRV